MVVCLSLGLVLPDLFAGNRDGLEAEGPRKEIGLQLYSVRQDMSRLYFCGNCRIFRW